MNRSDKGLNYYDLEFLVKNIPRNIEKLKLGSSFFYDELFEILLHRCHKIKVLSIKAEFLTDESFMMIRSLLDLTLEELSLGSKFECLIFPSLLALKSMSKLKILNLYCGKENDQKIQFMREFLPHLKINGVQN